MVTPTVADQARRRLPPEREVASACGDELGGVSTSGVLARSDVEAPTWRDNTPFLSEKTSSGFAFLALQSVGVQLEYPNRAPSAVAAGMRLAEEIQSSLASAVTGSFDNEMKSLRGRSWSL
jgi:hypothetical protein